MPTNSLPPVLVSIQVGKPKTMGTDSAIDPLDETWTSGIFKQPVAGSVWVSRTNIAGDAQADLKNHGGFDKAVCVYSTVHYPSWEQELGVAPLPGGAFGENLSISTLAEDDICIGDVWEIGSVQFQVSQPRQPCWKLGRKWRIKELPARVIQRGSTGWYFRVLAEGELCVGEPLQLVERPQPTWSVSRVNKVFYQQKHDIAANAEAATIDFLAESWAAAFKKRAQGTSAAG